MRCFQQGRVLARKLAAAERKQLGHHHVRLRVSESRQQKAGAFLQKVAVHLVAIRSKQSAKIGADTMNGRQLDEPDANRP